MVSAEDLGLLEFADDGADAWAILERTGIGAAPGAARGRQLPSWRDVKKALHTRSDSSSSLESRRRTVSQNEPNCGRNLRGVRDRLGTVKPNRLFFARRPRGPIDAAIGARDAAGTGRPFL